MELKDYNLKLVTIEERGTALQPINNCVINGKEYICNTDETVEKKLLIPVKELKFGCLMSIKQEKKTYIFRIEQFLWRWYVKIWEIPYEENIDYSKQKILEFICKNQTDKIFHME